MTIKRKDYMEIIGSYYPELEATCIGSPYIYENITWKCSNYPSKEELDINPS